MQERLSLKECRKLLGAETGDFSDESLTELRDGLYELSYTLADIYSDFRRIAEELGSDSTEPLTIAVMAAKQKFGYEDEFDDTYNPEYEDLDGSDGR